MEVEVDEQQPRGQRPGRRRAHVPGTARHRDERGFVPTSPVALLSIVAVVMAGVAFLATRGDEPREVEVATPSSSTTSASPLTTAPTPTPTTSPSPRRTKPPVDRGAVYVEVYNNSGIKGLAGGVADTATDIGWKVVGADNWYGTIPTTTVYYPRRFERAAKQLALDLGIDRTALAVDPMRNDRLTVILTGPIS